MSTPTPPVYLVRHGESEWNLLRLTQGQTTHPDLTDLGRDQARAAGRAVAADLAAHGWQGPVRVCSSDLVRAHRTAELLAQHLPGAGPVHDDPRLREQHLGRLEGRPYEETWAAAEEHDWSDDDAPVGGGESARQVRQRMTAALVDATGAGVPVVLVSHGETVRHVVQARTADGEPAWVPVPNGSVLRVLAGTGTWLPTGPAEPASEETGEVLVPALVPVS